jgi:hypothetical protein
MIGLVGDYKPPGAMPCTIIPHMNAGPSGELWDYVAYYYIN